MIFYQLMVFILLGIVVFIPVQIDVRVNYIIWILALILLPVFVKNFLSDIKSKNPITIFFLLFLLASALSTIFSIDQKRSLLTFFTYVSYFIIFTSIRTIFPSLKSKYLLTTSYILLTTILSIISLYKTLIGNYVNRETEGVSFMWMYYGHNHLSALLIFAVPISLYFLKVNWDNLKLRILLLVTCYLLLLSLFFTFGLSSMISLALTFLIVILLFRKSLNVRIPIIAVLITVSLFAIFSLTVFSTIKEAKGIGIRKNSPGSMQARLIYWQNAFDNFVSRPLIGSGLDTFRIINRTSKRKLPLGSYYAHNYFLQMLSDAGILGFASTILFIFSVIWESFKKIKMRLFYLAIWTGLFASIINTFFDFDWQMPTVFLIFWLFAAIL